MIVFVMVSGEAFHMPEPNCAALSTIVQLRTKPSVSLPMTSAPPTPRVVKSLRS
jgi:hypothetical protein